VILRLTYSDLILVEGGIDQTRAFPGDGSRQATRRYSLEKHGKAVGVLLWIEDSILPRDNVSGGRSRFCFSPTERRTNISSNGASSPKSFVYGSPSGRVVRRVAIWAVEGC